MKLRLFLFVLVVTCTFKATKADTYAQDEYYEDYENEINPENRFFVGSNEVSIEKEDRAGSTGIFGFFAAPANQAFFLIRMFFQWISLVGGFFVLHFMYWDYNDTQVGEEVNFIRLLNYFSNPENAVLEGLILLGHAATASALFFIPLIFWRGSPIPVTPTVVNFARSSSRDGCSNQRSTTAIQDSLPMALRSVLSPDGISRLILIMTLEHFGFILFWLLSPFFTGSAFSTTTSSARCIRETDDSFHDLSNQESFILRSINMDPENMHVNVSSPLYQTKLKQLFDFDKSKFSLRK